MDFTLFTDKELDWQAVFLQPAYKIGFEKCMTNAREQSEQKVAAFYLDRIRSCFPDSIELREDCSNRVKECTNFLKKFCLGRYSNIAVVSHRRVLREMTTTPFNPKGYGFENC